MLTILFLTLGGLFLAGLATDLLGRLTQLPRVSLLLLFGFLVGPDGLGVLPPLGEAWREGITNISLVMVGFLLGESLTRKRLRRHGREVMWISLTVTLVTAAIVAVGALALGAPLTLALFLGGIATATDPLATSDVIRENGSNGGFADTLRGVVAVDDAWGLLLFTLLLIVAEGLNGATQMGPILAHGATDLFGSIGLGLALGLPMALLTGRIRPGEPTQAEALGFVFLCAGLAMWLQLSFLLCAMIMGMAVANTARHHQYPFHAIEGIEWPFLILFFVLAGASLSAETLVSSGILTAGYIGLRIVGRILGARLGGRLAGADLATRRWMGPALLPQAGVATGMALLAVNRFPQYTEILIPVVISTTVIFELSGPVATRWALRRAVEMETANAEEATS